MKFLFHSFIVFLLSSSAFAQYILDPSVLILPDKDVTTGAISFPVPTIKEDVKYIGMGKTGTANGRKFNAMMYNPALLSRSRFSIDGLSISFSLPPNTYEAADFLVNNLQEFKDAFSFKAGLECCGRIKKCDGY